MRGGELTGASDVWPDPGRGRSVDAARVSLVGPRDIAEVVEAAADLTDDGAAANGRVIIAGKLRDPPAEVVGPGDAANRPIDAGAERLHAVLSLPSERVAIELTLRAALVDQASPLALSVAGIVPEVAMAFCHRRSRFATARKSNPGPDPTQSALSSSLPFRYLTP